MQKLASLRCPKAIRHHDTAWLAYYRTSSWKHLSLPADIHLHRVDDPLVGLAGMLRPTRILAGS